MTKGARKSHKIRLEGCRRNKLKEEEENHCRQVVSFRNEKLVALSARRGQLSKISLQGLLSIWAHNDPT